MIKSYLLALGLLITPHLLATDVETELEISQGYRRDKLTWSVPGYKGHPNIISELKYKHIDVYMSRLMASVTKDQFFGKAIFGYGVILHGKNTDSDYLEDNRRDEFSRSTSSVTGDYTIDAILKVGRHFHLTDSLTLSPSIGYSFYMQKLRDKHGHQEFEKYPAFSEKNKKIHGLNSTYQARWYSPQIGLRAEHSVDEKTSVFGEYTLLYPLNYRAKGYWNLRKMHFKQHGKATSSFGNVGTLGIQYRLTKNWALKLEGELLKFYAKGSSHPKTTRENSTIRKAHRTAWGSLLSLCYTF